MRVCDASTSISAEFGGIRDSCLDIYHLILGHLFNFAHAPVPSLTYCLGVKMLCGGGAQTHTNYRGALYCALWVP